MSKTLIDNLNRDGQHQVTERDLNEHLPLLDEQWLAANWTPEDKRTAEQAEKLSLSQQIVDEMKNADTLVICYESLILPDHRGGT